jgi:hypothetical protein
MNTRKELEEAMEREVREFWPGAGVTFADGGKHPKAKLTFDGKMLAVPFSGTSGSSRVVHHTLADIRRTLRKLGAERTKPDPTPDEDEAPYRKAVEQPAKADKVARAAEVASPRPTIADQLVSAGALTKDEARDPTIRAAAGFLAEDVDRDDAAAQLRAEFEARVAGIVDGIYFGLPADVYHAVPRLSSSGIQKLCVSPATFWRGSWLDPERPDPDEDETIWQLLGRAYHTARLEPHLFESTYCRECVKEDAPKGTLFTATDMGKKLEEFGLKKSGSVLEQAERLADAGFPSSQLWPLIKAAWEEDRAGRVALPAKHYDQMIIDRDRITLNSQIAPLLTGGEAEVSVFWTDQHGVQMKSRIDYLTRDHWADFKTFDNSRGKHLNQALADAVRYNRYYVQAAVYREAVEQIRVEGLQVVEADTDDQRSLIASLQLTSAELACWFIFQEKNGIPNLLAREFPFYSVPYSTILHDAGASEDQKAVAHEATRSRTDLFRKGDGEALQAKKLFVLYSEVYKDGTPWFPIDAVGRFHDEDFHPYWLSGDIE